MHSTNAEKRVDISLKPLASTAQRSLPPNLPVIVQTEYAARQVVIITAHYCMNMVIVVCYAADIVRALGLRPTRRVLTIFYQLCL